MRLAVIVATTALCVGGAAIADDAATKPDDGRIQIVPPQAPAKPPDLTVPPAPAPVAPPASPPPATEKLEQHEDPPPRGQSPDDLPRGEGAAAIPRERPSGIKAIEDWVRSLF